MATWQVIFIVFTLTHQGPSQGSMKENQSFKSEEACTQWADKMRPRVQDWIRGKIAADWEHPVIVDYKCELAGKDA